jgi:hypothetical protein
MKAIPKRIEGWELLGEPGPRTLSHARLELHHAAQVVASTAYTHLEPEPGASHTSMEWLSESRSLAGRPVRGERSFRVTLVVATLSLRLVDDARTVLDRFELEGRSVGQAYEWLESALASALGEDRAKPIVRPEHSIPHHPVAKGARFSMERRGAFEELARWFGNADRILRAVAEAVPGASPVRCWPHHFDIATRISLGAGEDPEGARSIGVGMTPGDEAISEPYWYVTPWPYPESTDLPTLDGKGEWHTAGWTGAILLGSRIAAGGSEGAQAEQVAAFLRSAVGGSLELLGG